VTPVGVNPAAITATFAKAHPNLNGATITPYILPGNPGPQPGFNIHDPLYQPVVPYYSIIQ
jgi:hypothetical protein